MTQRLTVPSHHLSEVTTLVCGRSRLVYLYLYIEIGPRSMHHVIWAVSHTCRHIVDAGPCDVAIGLWKK